MSESPPPSSGPGNGEAGGDSTKWPAEPPDAGADGPRPTDYTTANPAADDPTRVQQNWYTQPQQYAQPQTWYPQPQQDYTRVEQPHDYSQQQYYGPPQQQYPEPQYSYYQYTQPQYAYQQYAPPQYNPQQQYAPQQQYGPPQYSPQQWFRYPQPYQYPPTAGYGNQYPRRRVFGVVAAALTAIGGIVLIVSFVAVDWTHIGGTHAKFSDIRDSPLLNTPNAAALPHAYFNWLAWLLFGVVMVCGLVGALPTPAHVPFRVAGALLGITGMIFTYFAYYRLLGAVTHYTIGYGDSLQAATTGFYLALGGFLIAAVGAAIGPHRTTRASR